MIQQVSTSWHIGTPFSLMSESNRSSLILPQQSLEWSGCPSEIVPLRVGTEVASPSNLCVKCTGLFEGHMFKFDPVYEHWHHSSLQQSQKQGCHLCILLHQALQRSSPDFVPTGNPACRVQITRCSPLDNILKIDFIYRDARSNADSETVRRISLRAYPQRGIAFSLAID